MGYRLWSLIRRMGRWVWRHRFFVVVLCVLFLLWWGYTAVIAWLKAYSIRLADLETEASGIDFVANPAAYTSAQRSLNYARLEPFFYFLLLLIPGSLLTVLIACIYHYLGLSTPQKAKDAKVEAHEIRAKADSRRGSGNQRGKPPPRTPKGQSNDD